MSAGTLDALLGPIVARIPTGWRLKAVGAGAVVIVAFLAYRAIPYIFEDANRAAGERIVAAFEKYKAANGRYPERLDVLVPSFLPQVPKPAVDTNFVYAISPDEKTAFFAYQNPRETVTEYDSRTRRWQDLDYAESGALSMRAKQFVKGPRSPS
jgi:hypothetical protein